MSDNTRAMLIALAALGVVILAVLVLVSCGVGDMDKERNKCENAGGTFIEKSGNDWECIYDQGGSNA